MVDEVVADQGVEQVGVPGEVGAGDGDELAVAGGPRRGVVAVDQLAQGGGVAADQPADQGLVVGHGYTVVGSADDPLTAT